MSGDRDQDERDGHLDGAGSVGWDSNGHLGDTLPSELQGCEGVLCKREL